MLRTRNCFFYYTCKYVGHGRLLHVYIVRHFFVEIILSNVNVDFLSFISATNYKVKRFASKTALNNTYELIIRQYFYSSRLLQPKLLQERSHLCFKWPWAQVYVPMSARQRGDRLPNTYVLFSTLFGPRLFYTTSLPY